MQLALPLPTPANFARSSRTLNNRGMTSKNDDTVASELVRTSDRRKRGATTQSATALPALTPKEAAQKLRNKALRLLTTREHSKEELLRKLARAKARAARNSAQALDRDAQQREKGDIEAMVDDLAAQGWQSDERYADALIRRLAGQASRRYIADKLAHAGIKKEAAQLALEAFEQDDREVAHAVWQRRFGETPTTDKERQRQIRFLLSRGFHLSDAFRIVPKTNSTDNYPFELGE